jgi:hypothetical protein
VLSSPSTMTDHIHGGKLIFFFVIVCHDVNINLCCLRSYIMHTSKSFVFYIIYILESFAFGTFYNILTD